MTLPPAKAYLFDMDGTLVDNMPTHKISWLEWANKEGAEMTEESVWEKTHGTIREIVARFFPEASEEELFELGERKEALYREMFKPNLKLINGLGELLNQAKKAGVKMALATAGDKRNIAFVLDGLEIRSYFDAIVGGEDVSKGKPHPEVFLKAASALGVEPSDCIVFEDAPPGVESAHRAGMRCVLVNPSVPVAQYPNLEHVLAQASDYNNLEVFKAHT